MDRELVKSKIEKAGHRVVFDDHLPRRGPFALDVRRDKKGEYFHFQMEEDVEPSVLHTEGDHLLLMFKVPADRPHTPPNKFKAMIGHDERQLFVASIPENRPVTTVFSAKESLKPQAVKEFEKSIGLKTKDKQARHARGKAGSLKRRRQGDFYFIPKPNFQPPKFSSMNEGILKNEPISRGAGASHICEELVRAGGEDFWSFEMWSMDAKKREFAQRLMKDHASGFTGEERRKLWEDYPETKNWRWRSRRGGDIKVHVRGSIRHHEHATLTLDIWHEVIPNTENQSSMAAHVVFLD